MTQTLIPFRETKKANPDELHTGPYYGAALRKILTPPVERSLIERLSIFYREHPSFSVVLFVFGVVVASGTIALWIVRS